jgi:hypothetical protein
MNVPDILDLKMIIVTTDKSVYLKFTVTDHLRIHGHLINQDII